MTKQQSPEWFAARTGRVTGSRVGAILGLSPYQSRDDVLRAMVREYHNAPSEFTGNPATEWGNANEATAIGMFELESGLDVQETGFHPFDDWAGASPDGLIGDDAVLENKCPYGIRNKPDTRFKTLDEQPHYYAQVQFEMFCTGRKRFYFNQWTPHNHGYVEGKLDQAWLDQAIPELRQFHAFYLSELDNPEHLEPLRVEINTQSASMLLAEYDDMKEAKERADERMKEIIAELAQMTGGKNGLIDGRKFTKVIKSGSVSYAKVVKDHCPGIDLEPYRSKQSESWRIG